jgi:large subunit ribosomal protein L30
MADVQLKQVRSANGASEAQLQTLQTLRLGRIGREAKHADSPQLQGMIRAVSHLVEVDASGAPKRSGGATR